MKKALVVLSALFILILSVIGMTVFASATKIHSGTFSGNLTWRFDEAKGELTISGEGEMMDYPGLSLSEWDTYSSKMKSVIIEEGVTSIGDYSFGGYTSLTSVTIPSTVERIGRNAFHYCTSLKSITIPSSVSEMDVSAFSYCDQLIQVENGVSYVDQWAVACHSSVTSVALRKNTVGIAASAFKDCAQLTSVTIPSSVMTVCEDAFDGCHGLFKVENGVYYVDQWAVKFLPNTANDVAVVLRQDTVGIGNHIFYDSSVLRGITIPEGVKSIGNYAFYECWGLTSITLPDTVESIGRYAFSDCTGLERITLSKGLTTIREGAFYDCRSLKSLAIPSSVTHVGENAFRECRALAKVTFDPNSKLKTIGNAAFESCSSLTTAVLPGGLTSINDMLFSSCTALAEVMIPNSVTEIGRLAFYQSGVKAIVIPDGVTSMDGEAFLNCRSLTSIAIPTSVKTIGKSAFSGCSGLEKIVYLGTMEQWRAISKLADWDKNTGNYELEVHTHDDEAVITPPTCTEQGYTTHSCKACGESYVVTYGNALGHTYDNDKDASCNVCNEVREINQGCGASAHVYGDWMEHDEAQHKQTCACGDEVYADHSYEEWTVVTPATEQSEGERQGRCACGKTVSESIPKLTHKHEYVDTVTPPKCTEQGYTLHTCQGCGDSYRDSYVDGLGHVYDDDLDTTCNSCNALRENASAGETVSTAVPSESTGASGGKAEKEGGCGSIIAGEWAVTALLPAIAAYAANKKRREERH